ncbi:MAG: 30S ribosomal protein S9 [Parcubacteria group bacterium GW2011_GWC2_42_12]|uniref:Small ribosomal subunit protein uS9 n=1 Tax=Candidatus Falkowbacteria bacterium RIFCSPHIGHO2_02_FULL_42_9 TaxID=1797986 RepID=A0A1F5SA01_9BACT|nr:MAG: 30S ribosomal protein S9 [Parcubacteria group bacterium GW2011_GWC2_42_12]KKT45213.1 MAG: 30S ribosomal protein S9 [Parcubacteria group bacterium GW2011_GWA2_44_15]OGF23540.1 MAG: 30S ribosomal protein S9 [Candidatus Falkowbacteria bacterium RIFCSPHIGHO2_02_FULL_42_9]
MAELDKNLTPADEQVRLKGKYIGAIGRRKTATAQVRLYKSGHGAMTVNHLKASEYFKEGELFSIVSQPLKLTGLAKDFNLTILVFGGGRKSQAEAVRHGIARALLEFNPELRASLKVKGWLERDARKKERKKPGLKKARRAPQWAKR